MSWLQLHIYVKPQQVQQLEDALELCSAISITFQDRADEPIYEPGVGETPLWPSIKATALFNPDADPGAITKKLCGELGVPDLDCEIEILHDRDWEREWLDHFKPIQCGNRLWICPGWHEPPDPDAINVVLDPGLAFGTGTHETTKLCLQWLDQAQVNQNDVLDFGCGSGILGIAALLLGAKHVTFVDNDPQALAATLANLEKNNCHAKSYKVVHADAFVHKKNSAPAERFNLVIANILAQPLIDLAEQLCSAMSSDAALVLSGIRSEQKMAVEAAYHERISFFPALSENNWLCLTGVKKSPNNDY
jgi:ribosomal protein L11 methyltransferase